jgi:hypothetical protein
MNCYMFGFIAPEVVDAGGTLILLGSRIESLWFFLSMKISATVLGWEPIASSG